MAPYRVFFLLYWTLSTALYAEPFYFDKPNPERTICSEDNMVQMINQGGELRRMGTPIGIYRTGSLSCTGTMVSRDLFLTNRHCAASCSAIKVTFGYLSKEFPESRTYACAEIVEKGGSASYQDYMIVRLEGTPGDYWGWYPPSNRRLPQGYPLIMVHHPGGTPMKLSLDDCQYRYESGNMVHHRCDSNPGSSGSALLDADFENPKMTRVVGLHSMGGCNSSISSTNSGPSIHYLLSISPTLRSLVID